MTTILPFGHTWETALPWLRLNALEFSAVRSHAALAAFGGDPSAIFLASPSDWRERIPGLTEKQRARLAAICDKDFQKEWEILERLGGSIVTWQEPNYPSNLRQLTDCPPVLFVRGQLVPEDKFSIAIVGSRRASSYGLTLAQHFAKDLSAHGLAVVSGGARGVDTRAHRGTLDGGGRTIAFVGCGIDVDYPAENKALFTQMATHGGAVVSEFPLGIRPEPWRFPARNRLISGTCLGVLVIESPVDSGSLITAREAADQGRDVFAIPGPIDTGRNSGCHRLIKEGAKLVESVEDILEELGVLSLRSPGQEKPTGVTPQSTAHLNLPPEQTKILNMLTLQPQPVDALIVESGLSVSQVSGILTLLEMRGLCKRLPGNAFVRVL